MHPLNRGWVCGVVSVPFIGVSRSPRVALAALSTGHSGSQLGVILMPGASRCYNGWRLLEKPQPCPCLDLSQTLYMEQDHDPSHTAGYRHCRSTSLQGILEEGNYSPSYVVEKFGELLLDRHHLKPNLGTHITESTPIPTTDMHML